MPNHLIVGGGAFGLTAAIELRERGHAVTVLDAGPVGNPIAASHDLNKVVRAEYGADGLYREMVDAAIDGWHDWNALLGETVYVETGVLLLAGGAMVPGGYEYESLTLGRAAGDACERWTAAQVAERFPAWRTVGYPEALFNPRGGYTRSGRTVEKLGDLARARGVDLRYGVAVSGLLETGGRITGAITTAGQRVAADHTLVAAGAWTTRLLPELAPFVRATAHPLFYLRPADPTPYAPPAFCTFCADVARTGWYGCPVDPGTGLVKLAKHDDGDDVDADCDRDAVSAARVDELRTFLRSSLPGLADAPLAYTRRCVYTDTLDGHFWIDRHPAKAGLTVATGGSGHAMKMAPVLGGLIADVTEGKDNPWCDRFRWRDQPSAVPGDAARASADTP